MPKKNSSPDCRICYNALKSKISSCGCSVCETCWSRIIVTKIEESNSLPKKITCPTIRCQEEPSFKDLYQKLPRQHKLKIDQALLNVYISKTSDIRRCPSSECNYAGIISLSSSCSDNLVCNACGTTWREKVHYNKIEKFKDFIYSLIHNKNEVFSAMWKRRKAKKCPRCQVLIERSEGCLHMTCTQCKYQFCWTCLEKHPNHNQSKHNDIKPTIYKLILFFTVCLLLFYIYHSPFVNQLAQITIFPVTYTLWSDFGGVLKWIFSWLGAVILLSISLQCALVIHDKVVFKTDYYPEKKRIHVGIILVCLLVAYFFQLFPQMARLLGLGLVGLFLLILKDFLACPKRH